MRKFILFTLILGGRLIVFFENVHSSDYWQQDVHYKISVELNTTSHTLIGKEILTYKNNSPDTLSFVWFHLYPNAYQDNNSVFACESMKVGSSRFAFASAAERGYIQIDTIRAEGKTLPREFKPGDETEMKVMLSVPLLPGKSITFTITFFIKIPYIFSRFGHIDHHYECTQWYPKIVVYDKKGWHPDGYHQIGEFYGDFGTFDVDIMVPENMTVAATGDLITPKSEIARLDSLARLGARLDSLRDSKNNKAIKRILKQFSKFTLSSRQKTLHFHAEKVHDFAWVADYRFILKRGTHRKVTIQVFVLPHHEHQGKKAIEYTYDTLEYYGKYYAPYPYHQISVVDGDVSAGGGMEYPNLTIINFGFPGWLRLLEMVIMHEVGHNWFYGMLSNNEMDEAWLDEGMNSFAENRYMEEKYGKNGNMTNWQRYLSFMPQMSDRYIHSFMYYMFAVNHAEQPILTSAYNFREAYALVYGKAAWVMDMLRYVLGENKFDEVIQTYLARYQFKHPATDDFIAIAEEISGKKLDWFFDPWLRTTKQCDLTIKKIDKKKTNTGTKQLSVTIGQKGEIAMPTDLLIEHRNGPIVMKRWYGTGKDTTFQLTVPDWPKVVWVDPYDRILEVNNWNNRSPQKISLQPFFNVPAFDQYQIFFRPTLWYEDDVDGPRTGLLLSGGQYRDFDGLKGRYQWSLKGSFAFRSKKFSYSFGFKHPITWLGNYTRFELRGQDLEGQHNGFVGLNWRWSPYVVRDPQWRFQLRYFYQRVYNIDYVNKTDWEKGTTSGATATLNYASGHYRFPFSFSLSVSTASKRVKSDFDFAKVSLELDQHIQWTRKWETQIRLFGGYLKGNPGLQNQYFLSGSLVPTGPLAFLVDRRGRYTPQNYYFVEGDGNMRGYYRQHLAGKVMGTVNFQQKLPYVPLRLFYDIGDVWNKARAATVADLKQDAGFQLELGPIQLHVPFWVSHPLPDEKKFKYRWLISLKIPKMSIGF